ncbi:DoxX family protein [Pseudoxanthomonas sp. PXM02]|uniref:DoxX family protein n=1 Tax=Pseudoxanthomonas sp. PXM02 TaxID=2769294 RepID=UPI0017860BE7|nr:DoxX family protein [Pseudoxanthomonas sp. PXM02]MBD9477899.1 DoxX family protein [Pseudoxanthomonas sp. PXM02]
MSLHVLQPEHSLTDVGLLLLRLVAGGFLLPHGLGKLFGWFNGPGLKGFAGELRAFNLPARAPIPATLAALQTFAGMLVVVGLFTSYAALAGAGFLAFTAALNRRHGWFWMHGGMEYPLLWTVTLLSLALLGGGSLSLDAAGIIPLENMP